MTRQASLVLERHFCSTLDGNIVAAILLWKCESTCYLGLFSTLYWYVKGELSTPLNFVSLWLLTSSHDVMITNMGLRWKFLNAIDNFTFQSKLIMYNMYWKRKRSVRLPALQWTRVCVGKMSQLLTSIYPIVIRALKVNRIRCVTVWPCKSKAGLVFPIIFIPNVSILQWKCVGQSLLGSPRFCFSIPKEVFGPNDENIWLP